AFGTQVTLVEMLPHILPIEDADVSTRLEAIFKKRGIDVRANSKTERVEVKSDGVAVTVSRDGKSETINVDLVLLAVGVTGNVENLFAPSATPMMDRGAIKVDKSF
ncbi:Pyridine nucleotide-disulfide oxidoreductase, NAD-binding region domain protein, partial [mine drainage metagenome]